MDLNTLVQGSRIFGSILALLNFLGIIFLYTANRFAFRKIITNDLKHVAEDLHIITTEQGSIKSSVMSLREDVAYIKGRYDAQMAKPKRVYKSKSRSKTKTKGAKS